MNNLIVVTDKNRSAKGTFFKVGTAFTVTNAEGISPAQRHSEYTA